MKYSQEVKDYSDSIFPLINLWDWAIREPKKDLLTDKVSWGAYHTVNAEGVRWKKKITKTDIALVKDGKLRIYARSKSRKNSLLCWDIDCHNGESDGEDLLQKIEKEFPDSYVEKSDRGWHLFFLVEFLSEKQEQELICWGREQSRSFDAELELKGLPCKGSKILLPQEKVNLNYTTTTPKPDKPDIANGDGDRTPTELEYCDGWKTMRDLCWSLFKTNGECPTGEELVEEYENRFPEAGPQHSEREDRAFRVVEWYKNKYELTGFQGQRKRLIDLVKGLEKPDGLDNEHFAAVLWVIEKVSFEKHQDQRKQFGLPRQRVVEFIRRLTVDGVIKPGAVCRKRVGQMFSILVNASLIKCQDKKWFWNSGKGIAQKWTIGLRHPSYYKFISFFKSVVIKYIGRTSKSGSALKNIFSGKGVDSAIINGKMVSWRRNSNPVFTKGNLVTRKE